MAERSKRAQTRDQIPSQPLFRKQIGAPAAYESGQDKSGSQSWSRCATEGEESEQNSDKEAWSSEDITIDDYDSEQFDAIDLEQVPSEVYSRHTEHLVRTQKAIDQVWNSQSSREKPGNPPSYSRRHESRLVQRRGTTVETLTVTAAKKRSQSLKQVPVRLQEAPETDKPFKPELWGLSVSEAVDIAGHNIDRMPFTIYGTEVTFSGRVPIVVAKCIKKVLSSKNDAGECGISTTQFGSHTLQS